MAEKMITQGVVNSGYEYEKLVSAYFCLKLLQDVSIKNFVLNINPSAYRKFDDVTVSITYNDGHKEQFAMQLKHREAGRDILEARSELNREKKNFYIASYCAEFEKLPSDIQANYKFILFTNATFQNFHAVKNYKTESCTTPSKSNIFNTDKIYRFQEYTNCHAAFYRKFYLLSGQKNVSELEESIVQIFREYFHSDSNIATCYIDFFGSLRMGNYINAKITKEEVILKLTSLLLSNHVIRTPLREERDEKIQQLEEAIQQFDVTLLQDIDKDFVRDNWCYPNRQKHLVEDWARKNKMLRSKGQGRLNEQQKELLIYFKENLLFVTITKNCAELIYQIINLCKSAENVKIKFVLIGERIDNKNLEKWKIFGNLSDLKSNQELYKKMTTSFKISLQGRKAETLATLRSRFNLHFDEFITPNELFRMLQDDLLVGQAIEKLSGYYIPRILLKEEFSYKCLPEVCEQKTVIVQCNGKSKTFKESLKSEFRNLKFLDFSNFQQNPRDYTKSFLILTDEKLNQQLNSIFHLQLIDNNKLAWIDNKIKAEDLLILDKQVSVVCGTPGIGKSTMMKSLANECPLNYWVIIVPLKEHSWFFKKPSSTTNVLEYLFGSNNKIDKAIRECFKESRQILFLFDGLDELDSDSISNVINTIKQLKNEGYKIWIFCTKYLEKTLRRDLQIYSIYKIEDLKKADLKKYVCQHLQEKGVSAEKVAMITHKMFENKIEKDILKVPLFLFIASEIVSESENFDNLEDILTVTHMFSRFIERRFRHNLEKAGYKQQASLKVVIEGFRNYYLRECKFAALKSCLDPIHLENVKVKIDEEFVKLINEHGDFLGLILKIDRDDTFVFCHHSFAEYFAALWLSENFGELPLNVRSFIFDEKYYRIRYFFNVILAEGCPLHQAVLRQDVSEVENLIPTDWNTTDRGGRTPLHLASSFGQKYPILKDVDLSSNQCENFTTHQKILQCILRTEKIDSLQKDALFEYNCFEYADASLSLRSLEELSAYNKLEPDYLRNYEDLNSLCHYCVSFGFVNLLTNVIHLKGLSNLENFNKPLINLASECGQKEVVKLLIKNNVDLSRTCRDGRTALHEAALWGHNDLVKTLLDAKLDVNKKDSKKNTPLQLAVKMGHFNIVKTLVEGGADVNTTDEEGRTPLHKASYRANTDIVEYLIERGADVDCQDINQESSLQHAVQMGHFDVVKCLVKREANIQATDKSKRTALHWAAYEGYHVMVKYLVGNGINVVAMDDDGKTALQIAVERQHENIVNYLKDAELGILRKPSESAEERLQDLAKVTDLEKIQEIFESEDVNITDESNHTILHVASYHGNEHLVKYLLDKGAHTEAQNNDGRIPLHLASQFGHVSVMKLLLNRGSTKIEDNWGLTPLHRAAYKGQKEAVEVLLDAGFDPNLLNNHHSTPLHSAARGGHNDVIDLLIGKNANVEAVNVYKRTCLHEAARHGFTDTVRHLVKLCKDMVDAVDNEGRTALHLSAEKNYFTVVQTLVEAKANISLTDNYRKTALDVATENKRKEIVEYLQKHSQFTI